MFCGFPYFFPDLEELSTKIFHKRRKRSRVEMQCIYSGESTNNNCFVIGNQGCWKKWKSNRNTHLYLMFTFTRKITCYNNKQKKKQNESTSFHIFSYNSQRENAIITSITTSKCVCFCFLLGFPPIQDNRVFFSSQVLVIFLIGRMALYIC